MLKPIFKTAPAASKMTLTSKVVKSDSKIIFFLCSSKSVTHTVVVDMKRSEWAIQLLLSVTKAVNTHTHTHTYTHTQRPNEWRGVWQINFEHHNDIHFLSLHQCFPKTGPRTICDPPKLLNWSVKIFWGSKTCNI